MKKENFFKRHWIMLSVIALIVIYILYKRQPWVDRTPKTKIFYDMETTVHTWNLETVLTLQWSTQFADSQKLTFMKQWKVTSVNVKVWDKVKKDQIYKMKKILIQILLEEEIHKEKITYPKY